MKRLTLVMALVALGLLAVACGGGSDSPGTNATSQPGSGTGAKSLTVTITDTGMTVDNATLSEGALSMTVVNNSAVVRSVFLAPWTKTAAELPIDSDGQVDVLNDAPKGVKQSANIENVPAGGSRQKNIVLFKGKAIVFANNPGDIAAGIFAAIEVVPQ